MSKNHREPFARFNNKHGETVVKLYRHSATNIVVEVQDPFLHLLTDKPSGLHFAERYIAATKMGYRLTETLTRQRDNKTN